MSRPFYDYGANRHADRPIPMGRSVPISYPATRDPNACPTCNAVDDEPCTTHDAQPHRTRPKAKP